MTTDRQDMRSFSARILIHLVIFVSCLLGWSAPVHADESQGCDAVTALGVTRPAADYVLLVDISHTMDTPAGNFYRETRSQLRLILSYLFPDDHVTLISFATEPKTLFDGPAGRNPDDLLAKLPSQVASTVTGAEGALTDTGTALETVMPILLAPGRPNNATLVIFTDGRLDKVPSASRYANPDSAAWQLLREQASGIKREAFQTYYSPLTDIAGVPTLKIFPNARPLSASQTDFKAQIGLARDEIFLKAAKDAARLQLDGAVTAKLDGVRSLVAGRNSASLIFTSQPGSLAVSVRQIQVTSDKPSIKLEPAANASFKLEPGTSIKVPVDIIWTARAPNWSIWDIDEVHSAIAVTADIQSDCDASLSGELKMPFDWSLGGAPHDVTGRTQLGQPLLWAGLGVAVVVFVLGVIFAMPAKMSGSLSATASGQSLGKVRLRGRRLRLPADDLGGQGMPKLDSYGEAVVRGQRRLATIRGTTGITIKFIPKKASQNVARDTLPPNETRTLCGIEFRFGPDQPTDPQTETLQRPQDKL